MKASKILTWYMIIIYIITAFGLWFCIAERFVEIQNYLLSFELLSVLRGCRALIIDVLLSVNITALFTAFGFIIDYFSKKAKAKKELLQMYVVIRNNCFDKLLHKNNYYIEDCNEVRHILEYLNEKRNLVKDYQAPILKIYIKICNLIKKIFRNTDNDMGYLKENKYALILILYSDLLNYFFTLNIYQSNIQEQNSIIQLCEKKIIEQEKSGIKNSKYNTYLQLAKKEKDMCTKKLIL